MPFPTHFCLMRYSLLWLPTTQFQQHFLNPIYAIINSYFPRNRTLWEVVNVIPTILKRTVLQKQGLPEAILRVAAVPVKNPQPWATTSSNAEARCHKPFTNLNTAVQAHAAFLLSSLHFFCLFPIFFSFFIVSFPHLIPLIILSIAWLFKANHFHIRTIPASIKFYYGRRYLFWPFCPIFKPSYVLENFKPPK